MLISEIINDYLNRRVMTQRKFAEKCGISPSYLTQILKGRNPRTGKPPKLSIEIYQTLADAMGMTLDELFGLIDDSPVELKAKSKVDFFNLEELKHHKIPLIGSVAGGEPIYDEDYDLMIVGPHKASCAVRLKGDSMTPTYRNGDIIYIHEQPDVRDGEIAVVFLDDEAVLKRVYHTKYGLQLLSDNKNYKPIDATLGDYDNIRILGIPCGYTRMFDAESKEY